MVELLSKIENCTNKVEKYNLVIEYMEQEGISFKPAQNDHINNQYRVLSNKSSVFVYTNSFKFNLCDEDMKRLEKKVNLAFEPLYSNKKQFIIDKTRPWTCSFSDIETFKNVITILSGKELTGINVPRKPVNILGDTVTCPNCSGEFKKAERCPECGQLIDYSVAPLKSELSNLLSVEAFEKAYSSFLKQADENSISKKSQGSKIPYGFSEKLMCDGHLFKAQYGQGAASVTPYMNWWIVSIYYLPTSGKILLGIEEERCVNFLTKIDIEPIKYEQIGNKKTNIAVFYESHRNNINYSELYDEFVSVCEAVLPFSKAETE